MYVALLAGCATPHGPSSQDTKFKDSERDWVEIYRRELIICLENGDTEGFYFFMQELKNEKLRIRRPNPSP